MRQQVVLRRSSCLCDSTRLSLFDSRSINIDSRTKTNVGAPAGGKSAKVQLLVLDGDTCLLARAEK